MISRTFAMVTTCSQIFKLTIIIRPLNVNIFNIMT